MPTSSSSQFTLISLVAKRRKISCEDIFGGQTQQQPQSARGVDDVNLEVEPMVWSGFECLLDLLVLTFVPVIGFAVGSVF
jgi:hypothetical protein